MKALFTKHTEAKRFDTEQGGIIKGISPKKVIFIKVNQRRYEDQKADMTMIEKMSSDIMNAETHDEVLAHTCIAVGYVNAMKFHGIIDAEETTNLVDMLGAIGEDRLREVDKINLNIIMRHIRKKVIR